MHPRLQRALEVARGAKATDADRQAAERRARRTIPDEDWPAVQSVASGASSDGHPTRVVVDAAAVRAAMLRRLGAIA